MLDERKLEELNDELSYNEDVSRRNFFAKAGALTAGMAVAGGILGSLAGDKAEAAVQWPVAYKKLNIDLVRKTAHDGYFEANCCYGAAKGLLVGLRAATGSTSPWNLINEDMFRFGGGGISSWGTLCGALNGALFVVNLATTRFPDLCDELMNWYTKFPFPSTKCDAYSAFKRQKTSVADSPLCHNSVSIWCKEAGATVNSAAKKARCAKVTGDTAAKAAELLNKLLDTKVPYKKSVAFAAGTNFCMECHTGRGTTKGGLAKLDNEQGKMDCMECHDDEHDHSKPYFKKTCNTCHTVGK